MKAGIITFLHNDNFGSSLQAYALQRVIRDMGMDCEHLDYRPDRAEKIRNLLSSGNSLRLISDGMRKRRVKAGRAGAREKSAAIPAFYKRRMQLSAPCRNLQELKKISEGYDLLICGSDQIWNPVWLNPAYFLTFAEKGKPRIAYAASLGVKELPKEGKIRKIRKWTADFAAVSVREEEGALLLNRMTGRQVQVMPDPVCLLKREEWEKLAAGSPSEKPYALCYLIGENPEYPEKIRALQQETGLRVLMLPVTAQSYSLGYELLDGAGPEEFLGAVRDAAVFLTDSFHGLAFGKILGTEVRLLRRYRDEDPESKNSRVDHFLREAETKGLEAMRNEGLAWLHEQIGIVRAVQQTAGSEGT